MGDRHRTHQNPLASRLGGGADVCVVSMKSLHVLTEAKVSGCPGRHRNEDPVDNVNVVPILWSVNALTWRKNPAKLLGARPPCHGV